MSLAQEAFEHWAKSPEGRECRDAESMGGLRHDVAHVVRQAELTRRLCVAFMAGGISACPEWEKRLHEFGTYEKGWDSYKGAPPTPVAMALASAICAGLTVVPMSSGGVQVETHVHGLDLEIEVGPSGKLSTRVEVSQ